MINFAVTGDFWFFTWILLAFLLSGLFCAHAAWQCDAPCTGSSYLPLKKRPLCMALLLSVPLGIGQGIILQLAFEEFRAQRHQLASEGSTSMPLARPTSNRFHCKAVNGLFEGLSSCAVILYAFWSMGYPKSNPITDVKWVHEGSLLAVLGLISFLSAGLGLLEMDFCTSKAISKRMRRSTRYEVLHWLFRTTEVTSRVSLFINFMVTTRVHVGWWWIPLALDVAFTFLLVRLVGGVEKNSLVRLLVSFPCVFANVFLFLDSPIKRRAASRATWCLTAKHLLELAALPLLTLLGVEGLREELRCNWEMHWGMNLIAIVAQVMYLFLFWWVTSTSMQRHSYATADIFSACDRGCGVALRSAIRELSHSAAIGLNVNIFDIDGNTPLFLAAAKGHVDICQRLLREGARVDLRIFGDNRPVRHCFMLAVRRRWTALHIAAHRGHVEVVRVLLQAIHAGASRAADGGLTPASIEHLEAFQDTVMDTPLHVAARAGHAEVARLLAGMLPDWTEERNSHGETPRDISGTDEVKQAIDEVVLQPPDAMMSPRLPSGRSSGLLLRIEDQWPQVQLPIAKSSREVSLMAPGLSSYIACSCGGALGRVFLSEVPPSETALGSRLTSISEAGESLTGSLLQERASPGPSLPVVASSADSQTPRGLEMTISDLEPIDAAGQPVRWWQEMMQAQQRLPVPLSPTASARSVVTRTPEEAILGEGSYGLVWRAQDRTTKQWYAVKNIRTRRGSTSLAMNECDVADRIRLRPHPCLVRLHLVHNFTDAGIYALVMEFCPGGDMLSRIRKAREAVSEQGTYTPPSQALRWIAQVFLGLEHMHLRMDTLLRDLKPENVVLTEEGCAKLTDFGFGRFGVEATGCWSFGVPTGSPGYVAPEILRKEEYDYRVDLYSLGVLTWVLFTGGVTCRSEPQPPMGRMKNGGDYQALYQDCFLLARCIHSPERNFARPLRSDARDFVVRLIDRQPDTRMKHVQIREHRFLHPARLPDFGAPRSVVDAWCSAGDELVEARGDQPAA